MERKPSKAKRKPSVFGFNHIDIDHLEETLNELKKSLRLLPQALVLLQVPIQEAKKEPFRDQPGFRHARGNKNDSRRDHAAIISAAGVILKTAAEMKNYPNKIEKLNFTYTTYGKTLAEIRSFLRGEIYDRDSFLAKMKVQDEIIIDFGLSFEKFQEKYSRTFQKE